MRFRPMTFLAAAAGVLAASSAFGQAVTPPPGSKRYEMTPRASSSLLSNYGNAYELWHALVTACSGGCACSGGYGQGCALPCVRGWVLPLRSLLAGGYGQGSGMGCG
jgi:hypothetical protein